MSKVDKEALVALIQTHLEQLVNNHDAVEGALVATVDGHLITRCMHNATSVKRLASMGCSLLSLSNTITGELVMGNCRNVIIENEGGYVAFMHINKRLILVSFTQANNGLGLLISASRNCAQTIAKKISEYSIIKGE